MHRWNSAHWGVVWIISFIALISIIGNIYLLVIRDKKDHIASRQQQFPLLARRILIDDPTDVLINFLPLRRSLRAMTAPWKDTFAVYFEYLPTGASIGINEKDEYSIASLIKVPIAMAYYKKQERLGLDLLDNSVTIEKRHLDSSFGDLWQRGEGAHVRLEDVFHLMLVMSDNTAAKVLAATIPLEDFMSIFEGLDIDTQGNSGRTTISAKGSASILKALYFSAIVNEEHSQKILELLSQTPFNDKLVAGVPKDIRVSHKIGQYLDLYWDCGIVYIPERPYTLCMFSKGNQIEVPERMKEVSRVVYEYVVSANKSK